MHFTSNYWEQILQSVLSTLQSMILSGYLYNIQIDEFRKMIAVEELDSTWIKTSPEDPAEFVLRVYPLEQDSETDCNPQSEDQIPCPAPENELHDDLNDDPMPAGIRPSPAVADLRLLMAGLDLNKEAQEGKKEVESEHKKEWHIRWNKTIVFA